MKFENFEGQEKKSSALEREHKASFENIDDVNEVEKMIETELQALQWPDEDIVNLKLAAREQFLNVIMHGNLKLKKEEGETPSDFYLRAKKNESEIKEKSKVSLELRCDDNRTSITISGDGDFVPDHIPDPTTPEGMEELNHRGLYLIGRLVDQVDYFPGGATLTKNRSQDNF